MSENNKKYKNYLDTEHERMSKETVIFFKQRVEQNKGVAGISGGVEGVKKKLKEHSDENRNGKLKAQYFE